MTILGSRLKHYYFKLAWTTASATYLLGIFLSINYSPSAPLMYLALSITFFGSMGVFYYIWKIETQKVIELNNNSFEDDLIEQHSVNVAKGHPFFNKDRLEFIESTVRIVEETKCSHGLMLTPDSTAKIVRYLCGQNDDPNGGLPQNIYNFVDAKLAQKFINKEYDIEGDKKKIAKTQQKQ